MVWDQFQSDWLALIRVELDEAMSRRAATLARRFGLRAYDSVHLAAAERVFITVGAERFLFAAFDTKLTAGAGDLGMALLDRHGRD